MEHTTEETEANVEPLIGRAVLRTGKRHVTIQSRRRICNKIKVKAQYRKVEGIQMDSLQFL